MTIYPPAERTAVTTYTNSKIPEQLQQQQYPYHIWSNTNPLTGNGTANANNPNAINSASVAIPLVAQAPQQLQQMYQRNASANSYFQTQPHITAHGTALARNPAPATTYTPTTAPPSNLQRHQRAVSTNSYFYENAHIYQVPVQAQPQVLHASLRAYSPHTGTAHASAPSGNQPSHSYNPFASDDSPSTTAPCAVTYHQTAEENPNPIYQSQNTALAPQHNHRVIASTASMPPDAQNRDGIEREKSKHTYKAGSTNDTSDFWTQMGFDVQGKPSGEIDEDNSSESTRNLSGASTLGSSASSLTQTENQENEVPIKHNGIDKYGLPMGGEYYRATLCHGDLSTLLFRGEEMGRNLFSTAPTSFVQALGNRPVIGYTRQDSVIGKAGISLGNVLLKVQDQDVDDPKSAMHCIEEARDRNVGYRGIVLHMWKPPQSIRVTHAEDQYAVEYRKKETSVPRTSRDWKSKYVVVGGIIADPWMINMYYSKQDYDKTLFMINKKKSEVSVNICNSRKDYDKTVSQINEKKRKLSVKVKSWSLIGAKLLTPEPKTVHYIMQSCRRPWYYIVVLTMDGKAVKIGHPLREGIEPVLEAVKKGIEYTKTYKGF